MIIRKGLSIKDVLPSGMVLACFSTLNVIDKDGDITLPGFIGKQMVTMLPAHDWKHVPIGKGFTREAGDQVLADLKMNLEIPAAKDWHSALLFDLANPPSNQEYSYGFTIRDGGSSDGGCCCAAGSCACGCSPDACACRNGCACASKAYRTLRPTPAGGPGCIVHEVSPVLVGAGEMTGTLSAKGAKFGDELETALAAVDGLLTRAKSLADLRAKDGRGLSAANLERLKNLRDRLSAANGSISPLLQDDVDRIAARVEFRRHLLNQAGI